MTLQTERIRTIDQVAAFLNANEPEDFVPTDRASTFDFSQGRWHAGATAAWT